MEVQQQKKITEIFSTIGWKRQNAGRLVIEEKELLLKDLVARLPYGVIC